MKRSRLSVMCLALLAASALGWGQTEPVLPPAVAETDPTTAEEMSTRLARIPVDLPGWTIVEAPLTCDTTCLADHAPEDSDLIKSYDFQWSLTVRLMPAEPKQEIAAVIYRMGDALEAFGIFARHQGEHTTPAQVLTRSIWSGNQFHLWRGAFYIRVTPTTGDPLLRAAVMAAAEAIASKIPLPEQMPLMMRLMPQGRHLPHTLRYYHQTVLGQTQLGPGLVDAYLENGKTLTFVLLRAESQQAAIAVYAKAVMALSGGSPTVIVPDLGQAAATVSSSQYGLSYIMRERRYVAMTINVHDRTTAEGLLRIAGTNIRITRQ